MTQEATKITDDPRVSAETRVYYKKLRSIFMIIVMLVCFVAGVAVLVKAGNLKVGIGMMAGSVLLIAYAARRLMNREAQIILNNEGITTPSSGFKSWQDIKNEKVSYEIGSYASNRDMTVYRYLYYEFPTGNEKIYLYDMGITHRRLAKLLQIYRYRSERSFR